MKAKVFTPILSVVVVILTACGGGGNSITTPPTDPTITSVSLTAASSVVTAGQTDALTLAIVGTGAFTNTAELAVSPANAGTLNVSSKVAAGASIIFTPSTTLTASTQVSITAKSDEDSSKIGTVMITANPVASAITGVAITAASLAVTAGQTDTVTPTVTGTGSYANTVNLSASPASAVTLSATANVASGTAVPLTASSTITAATQVIITATSTQDSSKTNTVTITVNPATGVTVKSVTVTASPNTVSVGQTSTCTPLVTKSDGTTDALVKFTALDGTITPAGVYTATTAGAGSCTATSTEDSTVSGTASIAVTAATVTVKSVSVVCVPATITTSPTSTSQCTATTLYSNGTTKTGLATFTTSIGSITAAGVLSSTTTGSANVVATSTEDTAISSPAFVVTVTSSTLLPNISSISPPTLYADGLDPDQPLQINGSHFAVGQYFCFRYDGGNQGCQLISTVASSTQLNYSIAFDTSHYSPGWIILAICENSNFTNCGTPANWAFFGNQNVLSVSSTNEIGVLDQAQEAQQNGILWEYQPDGTLVSNTPVSSIDSAIATDDKTSDVVISQPTSTILVVDQTGKNGVDGTNTAMGVAAKNGYLFAAEPGANSLGCLDLTQPLGSQAITLSSAGNQPWSVDAGVFGGGTYAFTFSRNDTSLHKTDACAKAEAVTPLVLPGITPASTLQSLNPSIGGSYVQVFDEGPAAGTVAILSAGDKVLDLANASTMTVIGSPITLPGVPFRIAKDMTNGKIIIAFADAKDKLTTYSSIDLTAANPASTLTVLQATDTLLSVGFGVSNDGTKLYSAQRSALHILQNK